MIITAGDPTTRSASRRSTVTIGKPLSGVTAKSKLLENSAERWKQQRVRLPALV
jgi:hypothetical protein